MANSSSQKTVGLLGGSFNPAHDGHVHISCEARKQLRLDEIWWLVSPQNPLKAEAPLAFETRVELAQSLTTAHPFITVSDAEQTLGTQYTIDTIRALKQQHPEISFVWLMGADNLAQFHEWKDWEAIFEEVLIAVLDRKENSEAEQHSLAAQTYSSVFTTPKNLLLTKAPSWTFVKHALHSASSTQLREEAN